MTKLYLVPNLEVSAEPEIPNFDIITDEEKITWFEQAIKELEEKE